MSERRQDEEPEPSWPPYWFDIVYATVIALLGIAMLVTAFRVAD